MSKQHITLTTKARLAAKGRWSRQFEKLRKEWDTTALAFKRVDQRFDALILEWIAKGYIKATKPV